MASAQKVKSLTAPVHLRAEPGTPVPDLAAVGAALDIAADRPRAVTAEVRYLDTADLRLLRAGIVLSRRSTSSRTPAAADDDADDAAALAGEAGWVLELPAAGMGTRAIRLPLRGPSASAPRQLTSLVRATVRAGRLTTVARVRSELELHPLSAPAAGSGGGDEDGGGGERVRVLEVLARNTTATVPLPAGTGSAASGGQDPGGEDPGSGVSVTTTRELQVRAPGGQVPLKAKQVIALAEDVLAALTAAGAERSEPPAEAGSAAQLRRVLAEGGLPGAGALAGAPGREGRPAARLTTAGPAPEVARAAVGAALAAVAAADRDVRARDDAVPDGAPDGAGRDDAVPDGAPDGAGRDDAHEGLLVAAWRLRGAVELLAVSGESSEPGTADALAAGLARLTDVLATARDDRAVAASLTAQLAAEPDEQLLGTAAARLGAAATDLARAATDRVRAALSGGAYLAVLDDAERAATAPERGPGAAPAPGGASAKEVLLRRVARAHWRLVDAVDAVDGAHDQARRDELLGAVRTAAARCAGLGAALAPVVGEDAERYATAVATLEQALARAQVTVLARAVLRSLATAPPAPATGTGDGPAGALDGYTLGRLHAFQQVRGELAEDDVEHCWAQASRPRRRRWFA